MHFIAATRKEAETKAHTKRVTGYKEMLSTEMDTKALFSKFLAGGKPWTLPPEGLQLRKGCNLLMSTF